MNTKKISNILISIFMLFITAFFFACKTLPSEPVIPSPAEKEYKPVLSRKIMDQGKLSPAQLAHFFMTVCPDSNVMEIIEFAADYCAEARKEGVNSDVAFAQMCHETGFLRFGGLVQPEWHNYCGLGAMSKENPGCQFQTRTLGIRAHIQHLQAYGTTEDINLNQELIDPRYSWVHKTKFIEDISGLTGTWATDPEYSNKLENMLRRMEKANGLTN